MNRILSGTTSVAAIMLLSFPALAQVTPEDVWQNWQDAAASGGYAIDGASTARDGDTLTISDATFSFDDGAGSKVTIPISPITMTDNGDGTVAITYPETIDMSIPPAPSGETATVSISLPGNSTAASGTPDAVTYDSTLPSLTAKVGVTGGPSAGDFTVGMANATTSSTYTNDGTKVAVNGSYGADSVTVNGTFNDGTAGSSGTIAFSMAGMKSAFSGNLFGDAAAMQDMAKALADGVAFSGSTEFGAMSMTIDGADATGPTNVKIDATSGTGKFEMDADGFAYSIGMNGGALTMSGAQIPFPEARVGFGEMFFDLGMPLLASDTPGDFTFVTRLVDFTISEEIWGMIDPIQAFPRDPMTLIIDTNGQARLTTSIVDEAAMATLGDAPPGELNALNLNALQLKALGAEVTGDGALTFDNSDLVTFGGMPAPTGTINFAATGVNGLIDKLVSMGMLPEDQAMGARMMLSMFATVAADGSDSLTSVVEFKDKGLFVNGQQLQ